MTKRQFCMLNEVGDKRACSIRLFISELLSWCSGSKCLIERLSRMACSVFIVSTMTRSMFSASFKL